MTIVASALKSGQTHRVRSGAKIDGSNAEDVIDWVGMIFANMLPDLTNLSGRSRSPPRMAQGSPTRAIGSSRGRLAYFTC